MPPKVYDAGSNADDDLFRLSTSKPGRWDPNRSEPDGRSKAKPEQPGRAPADRHAGGGARQWRCSITAS